MKDVLSASHRRNCKLLGIWTGLGAGLALIIDLTRYLFGAHVGGAVLMAPTVFGIAYVGMRRYQQAPPIVSAVGALLLATVSGAWFYLIGL